MEAQQEKRLQEALGNPPAAAVAGSRHRVQSWFAQTAPLLQWDVVESPLGPLYVAISDRGVRHVDFGVSQGDFLSRLNPLARAEQDPTALAPVTAQLQAYFAGTRAQFDLDLDLDRLTSFQREVLLTAQSIPPGTVWTYGQVARAIGNPRASRAVGQALGRNPVPIVVPCHRVVANDMSLGGYSGGGGLASKRLLLHLEGALLA